MTKRLQVLLDEEEMRAIRASARARRMTVSEWARSALRAAHEGEPTAAVDQKIAVVRAASRQMFPSGEIGDMLAEIERGYLVEPEP